MIIGITIILIIILIYLIPITAGWGKNIHWVFGLELGYVSQWGYYFGLHFGKVFIAAGIFPNRPDAYQFNEKN